MELPHRHVCWAYDEPEGFLARARERVAEGVAAGNRVWYVPGGTVAGLDGAQVVPAGEAYPGVFDVYREATERAYMRGAPLTALCAYDRKSLAGGAAKRIVELLDLRRVLAG
ncbi:MEDS domain-containing protein [Dactylosporangium sp. AC04546]|uniref:MEDS domain-containing protein n=1 Tax=Dactylosporangium sp. AC04546 TaxID=2862460 RepID=UPI001EDF3CCF|nr:MEDS domain-containing protein [Dactylosporangium sp. AC04546]WVK81840.1 MEDS domain-containing protein [Dactylosporangium sp. AC04546]